MFLDIGAEVKHVLEQTKKKTI